MFYLYPNMGMLLQPNVWIDAANQVIYSLASCSGAMITLASYNRFNNSCLRDVFIITFVNYITSFLCGIVVFAFVGFLALTKNVAIPELVASGEELAYVVMPTVFGHLPGCVFWTVLFFLMLTFMAFSSQVVAVEVLSTSLTDQFPIMRRWKTLVTAALCATGLLLGLPMCSNGGHYILQLLNTYAGSGTFLVGLMMCICVVYVYGFWNFSKDISMMLGLSPIWNIPFIILWVFPMPLVFLGLYIVHFLQFNMPYYNGYQYPGWCLYFGIGIAIITPLVIIMTPIILMMMYTAQKRPLSHLFRPSKNWGPALPIDGRASPRYAYQRQYSMQP